MIICLLVRVIENVKANTLMGTFSNAVNIPPVELTSLFSIKAGQVSALNLVRFDDAESPFSCKTAQQQND